MLMMGMMLFGVKQFLEWNQVVLLFAKVGSRVGWVHMMIIPIVCTIKAIAYIYELLYRHDGWLLCRCWILEGENLISHWDKWLRGRIAWGFRKLKDKNLGESGRERESVLMMKQGNIISNVLLPTHIGTMLRENNATESINSIFRLLILSLSSSDVCCPSMYLPLLLLARALLLP